MKLVGKRIIITSFNFLELLGPRRKSISHCLPTRLQHSFLILRYASFKMPVLRTNSSLSIPVENGLDLRQLCTTGSTLLINDVCEENDDPETNKEDTRTYDHVGQPVKCFKTLESQMTAVDPQGYVKKKIVEVGGGLPLGEDCTVHIAFSGFWEDVEEPFDVQKIYKPLKVDLKDNSLLPGMEIAVKSMLVGELSVFILSYKVMYGELGVPPRIKPRADCVFYIKLIKSILTPVEGDISFSEPNMFVRVRKEVLKLYSSGVTLHKSGNTMAALQLFRKSTAMLHKCRLADESEEKKQEVLLIKLYLNMAICSNTLKQPLKACIACNELNRLRSLWNNPKALLQNAKALRMIGRYDEAMKRLLQAKRLAKSGLSGIEEEIALLQKTQNACDQNRLIARNFVERSLNLVSDNFKREIDVLIKKFKENDDLNKLMLPAGLNTEEVKYIKETCVRENLLCSRIGRDIAFAKTDDNLTAQEEEDLQSQDLSVCPDAPVNADS